MFKKSAPVLLLGMMLLAVPVAGMSQGKGADKGTTTVPVGGSMTVESLVQRYTPLAGSSSNATSLVNGLRSGSLVTLTLTVSVQGMCTVMVDNTSCFMMPGATSPTCMKVPGQHEEQRPCMKDEAMTATFTPPTGNMGLGNVDIALGFAQAQLVELGLGSPATPGQLVASLMGGEVEYGTTNPKSKKTLQGILALRASGKGWGQIAGDLGFKLQ